MQQNINRYLQRSESSGNASDRSPPKSAPIKRPRSSPEIVSSGREKKANIMSHTSRSDQALLASIRKIMDEKMAILPTKKDFEALHCDIRSLQDENRQLRDELTRLREDARERDQRIDYLELHARRNNLVVRGLKFKQSDNLREVAKGFFAEVLAAPDKLEVESARIVGSRGNDGGTLLVGMLSSSDKWSIINKASRLNGTGFSISQDFPPRMRKNISKLLRVRAELRKYGGDLICRVRADKLFVQDRIYIWDDVIGLRESRGQSKVSAIAGVDLSDVLKKLQEEREQDRERAKQ